MAKVNNIVEALYHDSPLPMVESFAVQMQDLVSVQLQQLRKTVATDILKEEQQPASDMDGAVVYVLEMLNNDGIETLTDAVQIAEHEFNVSADELNTKLKEYLNVEDYKPIAEEILNGLLESISDNEPFIISFKDNTAVRVEPEQANSILELWINLSPKNKHLMEENIGKSKSSFEKILDFIVKTYSPGRTE